MRSSRPERSRKRVERDQLLRLAAPADLSVAFARDDDRARTAPPGLRHLALDGAAGVVGVARHAGAPKLRDRGQHLLARRTVDDEEDVDAAPVRGNAFVLEREDQPLEAGAEPDPGRRRAADLLDEAVVAAAAADRRVDVLVRADELEGRARVVVEAAHE